MVSVRNRFEIVHDLTLKFISVVPIYDGEKKKTIPKKKENIKKSQKK